MSFNISDNTSNFWQHDAFNHCFFASSCGAIFFRAEELLRRQKQQRRQAEAKRKAEEQLQIQIRNPEQGVLVEVDD